MSWTRIATVVCVLLFSGSVALAQQRTGRVTGVITDANDQRPVPGVNVVLAGTTRGVVSGENGRYLLMNVPEGTYRVQAISIGYELAEQQVVVTADQTVVANLQLSTQAVKLQEIVAVGYGTQTRRDITGAVSSVSTEALETSVVRSIDQVLQGTSPGVQVTTASSEPGGALSIRIRGTSSITGNSEPLYVIDGFPIENDIEGSSVGNGGRDRTTPPNPLTTLNPSDIESISILKDASATAIYGARGANGVVIVTTKQGRGSRPQFTIDYYAGTQSVAKRYDLLNAQEYMDYANEYGANSSNPYTPFPDSVYSRVLASGVDTDWQDLIFRNAGVQNLQFSMIGASAATTSPTRYALSAGYFDQDGIVVGSGFRRFSGRLNLNQAIGARVELGGSFTASQARTQSVPTAGQQNAGAGAVSGALQYVPILPVKRADGSYSYIFSDLNAFNTLLDAPTTPNPVSMAREVMDSLGDTRLLGNVFARISVLPDLEARVSIGADNASRWRYTYYPRTTLRGQQSNGEAIRAQTNTFSWLNENSLTYRKKIGEVHDFTLLGGYTRQAQEVDGENMSNTNFVSDITGYFDIGAGTQEGGPSINSRRTRQTLESFLGRVNYSLLDRYLLTVTYRRDGSSRFAAGKKWGAFPSAAVAWRLSAEPWMAGREWLNELKLRASYGLVGNPSIRPYQSLARLNDQGYSFAGSPYSGYYPVAVGNPNLTWESTKQVDVGVDFGFLNRFMLTADWYQKNTTDLLLAINLPFETGFETALTNLGEVENRGFEVGLDARLIEPKRAGAFAWRANVNYATNRNRVVDLGGLQSIEADLLTTDYNLPGTHIEVGKPIGFFYGFRSEGVIRDSAQAATVTWTNFNGRAFEAGDMLVRDIAGRDSAGNLVRTPDGRITLDDRTDIGDPTPDFTIGLTNTFSWRAFELNALLQGAFGGKVLNINRIRLESGPRVNLSKDRWYNRWTPDRPDAEYPALGENPNQVGTNNFTSNLLEDGSYLRLRSATLSYQLPAAFQRRAGMSGGRIYVTGTNLFTITDYSGFDPDVSAQSVGNVNRGIDIGAYPLARTITVGVSLNY